MRTRRHKYVEFEKTLNPGLYDLVKDPRERHNLYGTPAGDLMYAELKRRLEGLKIETGLNKR